MVALDIQRERVTKNDTLAISLVFNQTPSGVDCIGTISNPMMEGNPFAKFLAKRLLRKFFEKL